MPELLLYDTPLSLSSSSSRSRQWHSAPRVVDVSTPEDRGQEVTAHSTTPQSQPRQPLTVKDPNTPIRSSERTLRKPSPGLIARLKLLDLRRRSSVVFAALVDQAEIGRIPESQLRLLEEQAKQKENRKVEIERRGRGWSAPASSALPPQLQLALPGVGGGDRESESFSSAMSAFVHESDASSIMSVSDRLMPSDSEAEDLHTDTQKYRLPAIGKSRGSSRNGFVLEDGSIASRDRDRPPTPPPKDPPSYRNSYIQNDADESRSTMTENSDLESYFNPSNLSRAGSVYTLSRASFANQLSQLTSIKLPQASSLSSSISAIPTSTGAARALNDASDQIRMWIKKASEVLNGLDAEDDVEWAAAGGREGLGDVDAAINRFETLIDVYVSAIEQLESRNDIDNLTAEELQGVVERMDRILKRWNQIKVTLKGVKEQVEVAMEWEELWNTVLGEIGQETEGISRMIFEMEERRHRGLLDAMAEPGAQLDIKELETIVEEAPSRAASAAAVTNGSPTSTVDKPAPHRPEEDKNLVGLFARMQPLRASLDFLPMRLSAFMTRAEVVFPTGCEELQRRQEFLEGKYKKLEADAESLRKELGEDRWVIIFRKASRQALKMCESVERSVTKLRDALDEGAQHTNPPALAKKIENYEAKKEHYGPAIQQVLAIIDKGVSTRLTVNGEILRLQGDMKRKWSELDAHTKALDFALDQLQINKGSSLRDSISTILSSQHSVASSSAGAITDTPGSSPASSVVFLGRRESNPSTPYAKSRQGSFASSTTARSQIGKRYSSMPNSMANSMGSGNQSNIPRKTPLSRSSVSELRPALGVSPRLYSTPTPRSVSRSESRTDNRSDRPRWNGSTNTGNTAIGHNFKPLSATIPSPYSKPPLRSVSTGQPSPLARSSFNSRPPSGMANQSRAPSTPPKVMPKLRTATSTAALMQQSRTSGSQTTKVTPLTAPQRASSHLPRASSYVSPYAQSQLSQPTTPLSNPPIIPSRTSSRSASRSTATVTNHSRAASTVITDTDTNAGADKGAITPASSTASPQQNEGNESPSQRLPKVRPTTSLAKGKRMSMLPMPKKTSTPDPSVSANGNDGAGTPSTGRLSRMGGRMSSLGGRMSSLSFNRPGSKDGTGKK